MRVRIYVPATVSTLDAVRTAGEVGPAPVTGFAVTPTLREWYAEGDEDELEYAAFSDAARASLRMLDADPLTPRRRVVLSADVPESTVTVHPDLDRAVVRVSGPVPVSSLACLHVDGADAEKDVAAAAAVALEADLGDEDAQFVVDGAEGHELEWYDVTEIDQVIDGGPPRT
jgi:hypothetical protein